MSKQLKLLLRNGQVITLNCGEYSMKRIIDLPRFIEMDDGVNKVYVSKDDITAYEIYSDRPKEQEMPNA